MSKEMNYESVQSCAVTVSLTSDDGSTSTKAFTIALTDHDEFDVTTPTDSDDTANTVAEDIANDCRRDHRLGQRRRWHHQHGTYTVHSQPCAGAFEISDDTSGVVTVADTTALDREAGDPP